MREYERAGHPPPEHDTVILTPRGPRTVSDVSFAPLAVSRPRTRTTGFGRIILAFLEVAVWCRTSPEVGTGVATGAAATSNVGSGVGVGVAVGTGVGAGVTVGRGVGVGEGVRVGVGVGVGAGPDADEIGPTELEIA